MKGTLLVILSCLLATSLARAQDVLLQDNFSSAHIGGPQWTAVYSHLPPDVMSLSVQSVMGGPIPFAATFELQKDAPSSARGQSIYFRSGPINVIAKKFSVEWYENIVDGFAGPLFELWGSVGVQPNDRSQKCLGVVRGLINLTINKSDVAAVQPGWRHFKITLDTDARTFDVFYENMDKPVASGLALASNPAAWDHIGIGFCLYISPGTHPTKWQVGGIKVTE